MKAPVRSQRNQSAATTSAPRPTAAPSAGLRPPIRLLFTPEPIRQRRRCEHSQHRLPLSAWAQPRSRAGVGGADRLSTSSKLWRFVAQSSVYLLADHQEVTRQNGGSFRHCVQQGLPSPFASTSDARRRRRAEELRLRQSQSVVSPVPQLAHLTAWRGEFREMKSAASTSHVHFHVRSRDP